MRRLHNFVANESLHPHDVFAQLRGITIIDQPEDLVVIYQSIQSKWKNIIWQYYRNEILKVPSF